MKKLLKYILIGLLLFISVLAINRLIKQDLQPEEPVVTQSVEENKLDEKGHYDSKDEVALFIHQYNRLPDNYVTKKEARKMGWVASKGNLRKVCESCSIGGDRFANREGLLPEKEGRVYYECDIDYDGGNRNGKRIVFSNDGLIYYSGDHYRNFELLYGEEK